MNDRDPAIELPLQSNLGQVLKETGRTDKAVVAAQRAVDLRSASGDYERLPLALSNLGSVQLAAGRVEQAFASLSDAWELATELKLPNRGNLATTLIVAQGRRESASMPCSASWRDRCSTIGRPAGGGGRIPYDWGRALCRTRRR